MRVLKHGAQTRPTSEGLDGWMEEGMDEGMDGTHRVSAPQSIPPDKSFKSTQEKQI